MGTEFKVIRGGKLLDIRAHAAPLRDVLISDGAIAEIGSTGLSVPEGTGEIDGHGLMMMPGLINAHTHGHGSLAKGLGDRWTLEHLLHAGPWINGQRTLEDKQLTTTLNAAEMVLKGCTASYDLYFEFPVPTLEGMHAVAKGYEDVGVRSTIAPMMADQTLYQAIPGLIEAFPAKARKQLEQIQAAPAERLLEASRALLENWPFDPARTKLALAPTIPLFCTDEFMIGCRDLAHEFDVGMHMHLSESRVQAVTGIRRYGKTLTAHLDEIGLLTHKFTGGHCIWMDDEDIQRMSDNGCSIAHNPGSNLRLGNGIAPVVQMRDRGVNVGIGTDGAHCADHQNMFEAMRLASFVCRNAEADAETWLETAEIIEMATGGSARALGFGDNIGALDKGAKADIVFLDLGGINFVPLNDPVNQIVNSEDSSAVHSVMVDGEFVLRDRRFVTIDYEKLRQDAQCASERLLSLNKEARDFATGLEKYVSQFCVGLAHEPYHIHRWCGGAPGKVSN